VPDAAVLDPPHRHLRSWHLPAPQKRGDGSRHYLPLSSEARADQGCRKRRYQVPDWSEIRCRFPPKSPAAFDGNQVPVCSDFCIQDALRLRLGKFGLTLEPTKTKLVEFGRFAQKHAGKRGRNRPETIYFLGLTLYCTRNQKGNLKVGMRTEKSRLRRSLTSLQELMQRIRHHTIGEQVGEINAALRGHYAYYGVAGNLRRLVKVYRVVERYWRRMLCSRSWAGRRLTWDAFNQIKERTPLLTPKLRLPYRELQALAVL
jgi:hypothetical protein